MKMISLVFVVAFFSCGFGSIHQDSPTIVIPDTPRVLIVDIPDGEKPPATMDNQESFSRPDLTLGCIENQAFPLVPRVWLIVGGKKILLVGETTEGRPKVLDWQILEFSLPPGMRQIIIERWRYLPNQGGWRQIPPEFITFQVAKPRRGWGDYYGSGYYGNNHYDWQIVIRQNRSFVYEGGRTNFYGHGRRGW